MKKTLLKEIKEMNKIAGTQMTKEQEISFIKNRLNELSISLKEMDFRNQKAFDSYQKQHKLRPNTKVTIAGKATTAGQAQSKSSEPVKGTSVFGGDSASSKPSVSLKADEDGYVSFDSAMSLEKALNKELGAYGSADVNDNGAIEYTIPNSEGDWDNALYVGKDNGEWIVSIESNGGTDNKKFGDDWHKTFDKPKDAVNHAIMIAKKYKKELGGV
jgi:hypothetical protein